MIVTQNLPFLSVGMNTLHSMAGVDILDFSAPGIR
jgi:hypothetical protein